MGRLRDRMTSNVKFLCHGCLERWQGEPERVDDAPEDSWHPWRYFHTCPECGTEATQDPSERGLLKAWALANGPSTPEGLQRAREAGAEAARKPKDPSVLARTRFNALKHGLHARVATFYPARPGKYPQCHGCEYLVQCGIESNACLKRADLFLKHHVAFETRNAAMLNGLHAELHANIRALLDDMILSVIGDGAALKSPEWYHDSDGNMRIARYQDADTGELRTIQKIEAHPLLKHIQMLIQATGMSLGDLGMTPKVQEEREELAGQLAGQRVDQQSALDYQRRQTEALESLSSLINKARADAAQDPVLLEYQQGQADGG